MVCKSKEIKISGWEAKAKGNLMLAFSPDPGDSKDSNIGSVSADLRRWIPGPVCPTPMPTFKQISPIFVCYLRSLKPVRIYSLTPLKMHMHMMRMCRSDLELSGKESHLLSAS